MISLNATNFLHMVIDVIISVQMSVGSELNPALFSLPAEDSSNDGLLIVDDAHTSFTPGNKSIYF